MRLEWTVKDRALVITLCDQDEDGREWVESEITIPLAAINIAAVTARATSKGGE